ncbi:myotubularin-related protein 14 [Octopus bimaculoides]|uniref:Tyrosine specific protein phosphatases domain-containing protein n=1 Tax=Octopus bimaculoides TaxID=37653 RepID=A0A0L8HE35_OCTBM|nr:myotubularin-related protein 14 [Octopus bimaculoides]|eukprot:XP_014773037.1 PREDICTED: myotubularin-related protein 14-like [Octopus bimaculoides]
MSGLKNREIVEEDLVKLLQHFIHTSHRANSKDDAKGLLYTDDCERLFNKDYAYTVIPNLNGELCCHYPYKVFVLEYEKQMVSNKELSNGQDSDVYENLLDIGKLKQFFWAARSARCRGRFVVPVILFEGKQICRSGTLSTGMEMFGRVGIDFFLSSDSSATASNISNLEQGKDGQSEWPSHDKIRGHDIKLLKYLKINYICDLMVEKKKVKYYMRVASSEKVDKESRYSDFCLLSLPYPGCEFFKEWKEHAYCGQEVKYDWNQPSIDAALDIPNELYSLTDVHWEFYKDWDLLLLTKNYFKLLISLIREGSSGILVHCISGWDRTPLYISLLRLSLWADGAIHQSLKPEEILYLTIAYDWYLFGHCLPDRIDKGEEIFRFCFHFLKFITSDDFSVYSGGSKRKSNNTSRPSSQAFPEDMKADFLDSVFHNNEGNAEKEPEKELEKELVVEISEFPQENKNENSAGNKENGEVTVTDSNLLPGSYSSSSMSTSPSGAQIFLSEDTQSAAYIHHKVPNTTDNTATATSTSLTAEKLHCQQLQRKLAQCGLSSLGSGDSGSSMSAARNIDIANEKTAPPASSPNHLGSVKHYTPGWFSSPAHSAHISSPATLTHSLSEENVPSRSSRLACVRNMFFHAYSIAESSSAANPSSMLDSLTEGFRWGSVKSDDM